MSETCASWPVSYAACGEQPTAAQLLDLVPFEEMAVDFLRRWTRGKVGLECATFRPCRQTCSSGPWTPTLIRGQWYNLGCGACFDSCGCSSVSTLRFDKPPWAIQEIVIDGELLAPEAYRLDEHVLLVRQDGGIWPSCQDLGLPAGQPGTWSITAQFGVPVPIGGQLAAGKLALELQKAACGASGCELPKRWQSISRQGVTISAMLDTFDDVDKGRTGIWLIDSWVASIVKPMPVFAIASPDIHPIGRRSWTR